MDLIYLLPAGMALAAFINGIRKGIDDEEYGMGKIKDPKVDKEKMFKINLAGAFLAFVFFLFLAFTSLIGSGLKILLTFVFVPLFFFVAALLNKKFKKKDENEDENEG